MGAEISFHYPTDIDLVASRKVLPFHIVSYLLIPFQEWNCIMVAYSLIASSTSTWTYILTRFQVNGNGGRDRSVKRLMPGVSILTFDCLHSWLTQSFPFEAQKCDLFPF